MSSGKHSLPGAVRELISGDSHHHGTRLLTAYLAGSIRDDCIDEDSGWREEMINALSGYPISFINPLGGKSFNKTTRDWDMSGIVPIADVIVPHDFYGIRTSDICIFNFRALSQGYANIGTLFECGAAAILSKLIYTIIDPDYSGHGNTKLFKLHPFIAKNSSVIFSDVPNCIEFLKSHVLVLSGANPHFGGIKE